MRSLSILLEQRRQLDAIDVRQAQVDKNEIRLQGYGRRDSLVAVLNFYGLVFHIADGLFWSGYAKQAAMHSDEKILRFEIFSDTAQHLSWIHARVGAVYH